MTMKKSLLYSCFALLLLAVACEKEVEIDIPVTEQSIVVEGSIEEGGFPRVILSKSLPYYSPINEKTLANLFVNNAEVRIVVNGDTILLDKLCLSDVPDSLVDEVSALLNLPPGFDQFCIYLSFDPRVLGKSNTNYELIVDAEGKHLTANTFIPKAIPLDSLWFKQDGNMDSLGFIFAQLSDPAVVGNAYRWYAQRINSYNYGPDAGNPKDADFIAPFNSAFDDEFFNGKSFPFAYNRGTASGSTKSDDVGIEGGYFKRGDTVVVKFTTIDYNVYQHFRSYYNSIGSSGSPFASPANVKSTIQGGLGIWAGYGVSLDTLTIK